MPRERGASHGSPPKSPTVRGGHFTNTATRVSKKTRREECREKPEANVPITRTNRLFGPGHPSMCEREGCHGNRANTRHPKEKGKGGERSRRWEGDRRPDPNETRQETEGKSPPPRLLHAVRDRTEPCLPPKSNSTGEMVRLQNEPQREISDPRKEIEDKTCVGTNKREAARKLASFPMWLACPFSLRPPEHPPPAALLSSRPPPTSLVL